MSGFLIQLVVCSSVMSVMIMLFFALTPITSKRYSAKCRYYCWLVVVIGLLLPYRPRLSLPVMHIPAAVEHPATALDTAVSAAASMPFTQLLQQAHSIPAWCFRLSGAIWAAGFLGILLYEVIRYLRFAASVKRWSICGDSPRIAEIVLHESELLHISTPVEVWLCRCSVRPMMIGFVHPVIILPQEAADWDAERVSLILRHELVHHRHKDLWVKALVLAVTGLHWFNPLVWLMSAEISRQCEVACDEDTVKTEDMRTRQLYGETLLRAASITMSSCPTLSTSFIGGTYNMKERILSLLDTKKKRIGACLIAIAIIGSLATGAALAAVSANNIRQQENPGLILAERVKKPEGSTFEKNLEKLRFKSKLLPDGTDPTTINSYETEVEKYFEVPAGTKFPFEGFSDSLSFSQQNSEYAGTFSGTLQFTWGIRVNEVASGDSMKFLLGYRGVLSRE